MICYIFIYGHIFKYNFCLFLYVIFVSVRHHSFLHVNFRFSTLLFMFRRNAFPYITIHLSYHNITVSIHHISFPSHHLSCSATSPFVSLCYFSFLYATFCFSTSYSVFVSHPSFLYVTFSFSTSHSVSVSHRSFFFYVIHRFSTSPFVFRNVKFCFSASLFVFRAPLVSLRYFSSFCVTHRFSKSPFMFYQTTFRFSTSHSVFERHTPFSTSLFVSLHQFLCSAKPFFVFCSAPIVSLRHFTFSTPSIVSLRHLPFLYVTFRFSTSLRVPSRHPLFLYVTFPVPSRHLSYRHVILRITTPLFVLLCHL